MSDNQPVTEQINARFLTAEDCNIAASVLYQAYREDSLLQQILDFDAANPTSFEKRLRLLVKEELSSFWQSHQHLIGVFVDNNLLAVSCVLKANSELSAERVWHWRLKLMLNAGWLSTNQLIEKEKRLQQALHDYPNSCFISLFAVDPHVQHQGLGRYLLRAVDDIVKTDNASGSAVFVTREQHAALFLSEGYQLAETLTFTKITGQLLYKSR